MLQKPEISASSMGLHGSEKKLFLLLSNECLKSFRAKLSVRSLSFEEGPLIGLKCQALKHQVLEGKSFFRK